MGALESTESTTTRKPAGHLAPASFMWSHIARLAPQGLPRIPRALRGVYRSSLALKLGRLGGKMAFVAGAGIAAVGALGMTNGAQISVEEEFGFGLVGVGGRGDGLVEGS
eukprot:387588-Amorphochlora_amoeboformis.AAC.1